ncbi:MAG: hypothetical protein H6765_02960 [Candidatus Peribacteria bacterium]|nr:MAG: hypothetical protein H6765_02960 [Candidatus Peribacteria bacterium]
MNCKIELNACGDGNIDEAAGEQCDDGNKLEGDGCSAECQLEPGSTLDMYSRFLDVLVEHSAPCGLGAEVFATPKVMKTAYARNTKAVNLLKTACIIDGYSK